MKKDVPLGTAIQKNNTDLNATFLVIKMLNISITALSSENKQMARFCRQAIEIVSRVLITEKTYDKQNSLGT